MQIKSLIIASAFCLLAACTAGRIKPGRSPQADPTLKGAAAMTRRLVGAAVDPTDLKNDPQYGATLAREFSVLTTENALKFRMVEPAQGQFDFSGGDAIVSFAQAHGMSVRGHNFVWHRGVPLWVTNGNRSSDDLSALLRNHIRTVVQHYKSVFPGVVRYWDVVNEAVGKNAVLRADSPWARIGTQPTDYIARAFQWAHEADPALLLFYNDYSIEQINAKSNAVYSMIRSLLGAGIPIHGIGFQMHFQDASVNQDGSPDDWDSMSKNFDRFAALGLEIHITELDDRLDLRALGSPTAAQLQAQADIFGHVGKLCMSKPACRVLVNWGFTEKYSYIQQEQPGFGSGFILDSHYQPKPAYSALLSSFLANP